MSENKYKELDKYFERLKDIKKGEIGFYYDNLEFLMDLSHSVMSFNNNIKPDENKKQRYVSSIDKVLIQNVLREISSRIINTYHDLDETNKIHLLYENEDLPDTQSRYEKGNLYYTFSNNYDYLSTLVHELMHATNIDPNNNYLTPAVLTEFISIYFEMYTKELLPNFGIDNKEIDYTSRFKYGMTYTEFKFVIPLLVKIKYGEINKENMNKLHEEKHYFETIEDYNYDSICDSLNSYMFSAIISSNEEIINKSLMEYMKAAFIKLKYNLNTSLAFYALDKLDKNKVNDINEQMINNPNINVQELFNEMGIKLDQDFIDNSIESMNSYYQKHNKKVLI